MGVRAETNADVNGHELALHAEEEDDRVVTTFRWPAALGGQDISVIGSFTDWQTPIALRSSSETKDFVRTLALQPGTYQYKFVVDGEWVTSPVEPITGDGQGMFNNQRLVAPSANFKWKAAWGGSEVFVTGDFTAWAELIPLRLNHLSGDFLLSCSLPPGTYSYQYLVDGIWMTSPDASVGPDDDGHLCNKMTVEVPPAFHIYYATGWEQPVLNVRALSADGTQQTSGWREVPMQNTPSRARPSGGWWKMAVIPASGDVTEGTPQLEFFVSSGSGIEVDKPAWGDSYRCNCPGGYKLQHGRLRPFPRALCDQVSDLDGTMVGDGEEADAGTREFCSYWEDNAALSGGVLVYNTGRSLGQFMGLWQSKGGALSLPDVLITAVGTKIFLLDVKEQDRSRADGLLWKQDTQWARILDEGWDLGRVKEVAGHVVGMVGSSCAQWLDDGSEHPHRIALSVRQDKVHEVSERLKEGFLQRDVQVRIILSGTGDWRYVDCVSIQGGKLEALERVRTLFGVPRERCVAAGDSGNDILMLEGANPAIVVGNAQPTLMDWLVMQPQNDRIVFTTAEIARGILEGISRHGLY
ncbi:g6650 [Coccomyxa elongata]